ncbi:phosphatidate phosphatase LPIN3 isoform X2 [Aethina tumida]|uniref:phosphatidate phosphatase LPIN3 isoform X2 n=1 Tax=Aethina tumida TaxID=116153 RepID=UPI00214765D9|nr:phosphatidate phosphatase LPIN3 isoform X2 [Aethina tumida]XP_049819416.1 phosphatidate phosphatase LPIN3 isoform X2 [Aethina tumida]
MNGMMKMFSSVKDFYNEINGATLTGAIDVIVVEQPDGSYNCSPFHVRFGKLGVLRSREKVVDIIINKEPQNIHMKLGESGEAFFVEELVDENDIPEHLATSPIPVEFEDMLKHQGRRRSLDLESGELPNLDNQVNDYSKRRYTADNENGKTRERNFIQRQIGLGNIETLENSAEEMTHSIHSAKMSSEDVSKSNDISETIFKMDSLDMEGSKSEEVTKTPVQGTPNETKSSKKKKKKMRKKNAARKSINNSNTNSTAEQSEKISDSNTSSLDSNSSEPELQKLEKEEKEMIDSLKMIPDFHFFSDTEVTNSTANDSRSGSPTHVESVQSDSEIEVKKMKGKFYKPLMWQSNYIFLEDVQSSKNWEWGGFPSLSETTSPTSENPTKEEQKSMLSGMFSFMKQKHSAQNQLMEGGRYLSEITNNIDPEVTEIYFNKRAESDMDCESGNGPSLAQSPITAEMGKSLDSDFDEQKSTHIFSHDISLSLCGWDPMPSEEKFLEHTVKFSDLCNNPVLFEDNNLVVRIKDKYYSWKVAAPIIATIMVYGRPLLQSSVDHLVSLHMPSAPTGDKGISKQESQESTRSWSAWWRGRKTTRETTSVTEPSEIKTTTDAKEEKIVEEVIQETITDSPTATTPNKPKEIHIPIEKEDEVINVKESPSSDKFRKTLRLSSKQIHSLNLKDGVNEVEFSVTTAYQGTTRCQCHLYKWKWDDKIVISDIDGTITRSDVLGHILPIVGKDWAQTGVAQLFNKIKDNGYKLLYLSARAIGQARITRDYLRSIKQGDLNMPDGPILLNPTSLIAAFHREVIEKKPEQFKISCMSDIKALFPPDSNPFYAGYGNRINDVWAYRAVGIPIVRIFTINPKGELKHELTQTFQSSYSGQSLVVNDVFPPILSKICESDSDEIESDYSDDDSVTS